MVQQGNTYFLLQCQEIMNFLFLDDFIANCKIPLAELIEKEAQPVHDIWVNLEPKVQIIRALDPCNMVFLDRLWCKHRFDESCPLKRLHLRTILLIRRTAFIIIY